MKQFRLIIIAFTTVLFSACSFQPKPITNEPEIVTQANFFKQFGGQLNINPGAEPSMALDRAGNPVVVWQEDDGTSFNIYVERWDGNNWVLLGDALDVDFNQNASYPSLALDSSDNLVVSWVEDTSVISSSIYVKRWNGSNWEHIGGVLNVNPNTIAAKRPSLALDSSGNPTVSWEECVTTFLFGCSDFNLYVKRWNSGSWAQVGGELDINTIQSVYERSPSLALDSSGNPVVSWTEYDGTSDNIYVKRWNGSSWVQLGGILDANANTNQAAFSPSLALDSSGNPVVSWYESDGTSGYPFNIYVKRWNGSSWVQLGDILDVNTNQSSENPSLALDSAGNPVVSWSEYDGTSWNIYVKRWNGTIWTQIGIHWDISKNLFALTPSLAVDVSGNPVVAWRECSYSNSFNCDVTSKIYVKGYYKNAFKQLGGILDIFSSAEATDPSIALDNNNQAAVAWTEFSAFSNNSTDIYVRRWTTGWTTALGPVDSVSSRNVYAPSLAVEKSTNVNAFNPVIAWEEDNGANRDIYVKRWNGSAWTNYRSGTPLDKSASNSAAQPSLVLDSNNRPYVAWTERVGTTNNIYVKRWTGTAWAWVGGSAGIDFSLSNEATFPSLAIGSDNKPVIAWTEENTTTFNGNIYVKKLVGNTWTLVGTTAIDRSIANYALSPSLDLDSSNNPMVAWEEQLASGDSNIYAKRWNGSSWVSLGNILDKLPSNLTGHPTLATGTNNNPLVSWTEFDLLGSDTYNVYVKRWTGTAWQNVSTGALDVNLANNAYNSSIVLNASNNPIVAWQESTGSSELDNIYVKGF